MRASLHEMLIKDQMKYNHNNKEEQTFPDCDEIFQSIQENQVNVKNALCIAMGGLTEYMERFTNFINNTQENEKIKQENETIKQENEAIKRENETIKQEKVKAVETLEIIVQAIKNSKSIGNFGNDDRYER
nr:1126_t:CDS:2 [Entrophospora candida]